MGNMAAQLPGTVFNQFMQGTGQGLANVGQGMNNMNMAGQMQMMPLQALGLGGGVFSQGLNMPIQAASSIYDLSRNPLNAFSNFINSVPNVSQSDTSGFITSLFK